jgi:hypothetical protein
MIRSTHSIPEVRSLTPWRRNVLTNAAGNTLRHHLHFFGTIALAFLLPAVTLWLVPFRWLLPSLLIALMATVIYFPIGARMLRPRLRRLMTNRRGRPFVCFDCGYRLVGLREGRCPECGQSAATPDGGRLRRKP